MLPVSPWIVLLNPRVKHKHGEGFNKTMFISLRQSYLKKKKEAHPGTALVALEIEWLPVKAPHPNPKKGKRFQDQPRHVRVPLGRL